jgi:hypothetical protein
MVPCTTCGIVKREYITDVCQTLPEATSLITCHDTLTRGYGAGGLSHYTLHSYAIVAYRNYLFGAGIHAVIDGLADFTLQHRLNCWVALRLLEYTFPSAPTYEL